MEELLAELEEMQYEVDECTEAGLEELDFND